MTDEQRKARLHHHMYETCEGIAEHAERIVRLEEENAKLLELLQRTWNIFHDATAREFNDTKNELRELGIKVGE